MLFSHLLLYNMLQNGDCSNQITSSCIQSLGHNKVVSLSSVCHILQSQVNDKIHHCTNDRVIVITFVKWKVFLLVFYQ